MEPIAVRPGDAAKMLGVSRATIYILTADGTLPSFTVGSARLIAMDDLRAFINRQKAAEVRD